MSGGPRGVWGLGVALLLAAGLLTAGGLGAGCGTERGGRPSSSEAPAGSGALPPGADGATGGTADAAPEEDGAADEQAALAGPEAPGGRQLNLAGPGGFADLAVSGRRVLLAWVEALADGPAVQLQASADEGATFGPPQRLSRPGSRPLVVRVVASGERVSVLWTVGGVGVSPRVWLRASTDGGATFGPEQPLPVRGLADVVAEGAHLSVVWNEQPPEYGDEEAELLFQASPDGGRTWGPVQDLNRAREWGAVALLARGERVWLLWDDRGQNDDPAIFLRESADHGASWGPILEPAEGARHLRDERMLLQGERLHVVWSQCAGFASAAPCHVALRTQPRGGAPLGPIQVLSQAPGQAIAPELAADGETLHAVWLEGSLSETDVVYRQSPDAGGTFLPARRLTAQPALRLFPGVAARDGSVFFTWELHQDVRTALLFREGHVQATAPGGVVLGDVELLSRGSNPRGPELATTPRHLHALWVEGPFDARRVRYWRR